MKNAKVVYEYGKCHTCNEPLRSKRINQDFWIKGKLLVVEGVPAGVCPQCGEKVVNAEVGRRIASLLHGAARLRTTRTLTVPVIRFSKKAA
jgi:YgiT-type zinc finger domain-containing protein